MGGCLMDRGGGGNPLGRTRRASCTQGKLHAPSPPQALPGGTDSWLSRPIPPLPLFTSAYEWSKDRLGKNGKWGASVAWRPAPLRPGPGLAGRGGVAAGAQGTYPLLAATCSWCTPGTPIGPPRRGPRSARLRRPGDWRGTALAPPPPRRHPRRPAARRRRPPGRRSPAFPSYCCIPQPRAGRGRGGSAAHRLQRAAGQAGEGRRAGGREGCSSEVVGGEERAAAGDWPPPCNRPTAPHMQHVRPAAADKMEDRENKTVGSEGRERGAVGGGGQRCGENR